MTDESASETPKCSKPDCDEGADALYTNGVFDEPRCEEHAQGDHLEIVESFRGVP